LKVHYRIHNCLPPVCPEPTQSSPYLHIPLPEDLNKLSFALNISAIINLLEIGESDGRDINYARER
jgi:hypothetical protein